jgi:hypothetical protein
MSIQINVGDTIQSGDYIIRKLDDRWVAMFVTDKTYAIGYQIAYIGSNPYNAMQGLRGEAFSREYQRDEIFKNKKQRMTNLVQEARKKAGWTAWKRNTTPMWWNTKNRTVEDEPQEVQTLMPQLNDILAEKYAFVENVPTKIS